MMLSLTTFSQTGTKTKCFPESVAKMIAKDLLSGDSAKVQLKLTEEQLLETEKKVDLKDSVITTMKLKEVNYNNVDYGESAPVTIAMTIAFDNALQTPTGSGIGAQVTRTLGTVITG